MPINSSLYLFFLGCGALVHQLLPLQHRRVWLLLLSLMFYAYAGTSSFIIFIGITLVTFFFQEYLWLTVILLVALLGYFKYISTGQILFPLGLSYVVFECIHLVADRKRGALNHVSLYELVQFTFFFPARSAGPIKRIEDFREDLANSSVTKEHLAYGLFFLILGYAQKTIIADSLTGVTDILGTPDQLRGSLDTLLLLYAYSIRIYADFAGLTSIAIGSALLFGIRVPKNFHYPYLQPNIARFWRSWHMSLSDWARDYIYIPLGGNRVSYLRNLLNLMIVMLAIGLWHGSTLNFAAWGLYQGVGLCIHRIWLSAIGTRIPHTWWTYALGMLLTFHFVTVGWALFVTTSLTDSMYILSALFSL
ncbi:MAG: MBOAT family protein [Candidatus Peregrinibacteria bacterium]|nr:MBOAT family protein [Candidatus Peregrinibacteria bacterium]MCB9808635.1 MBOAT family protein [Candidatus Peribacteria bacterium]